MQKSPLGKCVLALAVGSLSVAAHAGPVLYVSDTFLDTVRAFDTATNLEVGDPIPVSHTRPLAPVVSPDGQFVYVQSTDGAISVIDASLHAVTRTFDDPNPNAPDGPASMTVSPDGKTLYAAAARTGAIARIDTSSGEVLSRIEDTALSAPSPILRASHDGRRLYTLSGLSGTIVALDAASGARVGEVTVPLSGTYDQVSGFVLTADDTTIAAVTYLGDLVTIDTATMSLRKSQQIGRTLYGVDLSPDGTRAFVAETNDACVIDVDMTSAVLSGTATGIASNACFSVAAARDGHSAYLSNYDIGTATYYVLAFDIADHSIRDVATFGYPNFDSQSIAAAVGTPAPGLWWNPAESGRSFDIEVRHGTLVLSAQAYDNNGGPTWLLASGPYDAATGTFSGTFTRYTNGQCLGCGYRAPEASPIVGFDVQLRFSSATRGTLTFDGVDVPIEKFDW